MAGRLYYPMQVKHYEEGDEFFAFTKPNHATQPIWGAYPKSMSSGTQAEAAALYNAINQKLAVVMGVSSALNPDRLRILLGQDERYLHTCAGLYSDKNWKDEDCENNRLMLWGFKIIPVSAKNCLEIVISTEK